MEMNKLVTAEINLVNKMLQAHQVRARAQQKRTLVIKSGFISYGLDVAPGEKIAKIGTILREMADALTRQRRRTGLADLVPVRLSENPLALEVPHPAPTVLQWGYRPIEQTPAHSMLIGRSYLGSAQTERIAFDDAPHMLIVGTTGAGKSVLLQMMLLSLCHNTSPADLKILLIDLKNEDMVPFENLPHIMTFAGTVDAAVNAIRYAQQEKNLRVERRNYQPFRLVVWIDELAQLAQMKEARDMLGDIASIGRSKAVNLIAATQHPTNEGGMGSMMKANFPVRLVGMVAPGQSHIATGRPQLHADLLPGRGSFLRVQGVDARRFQSFMIGTGDVQAMAGYITKLYGSVPEHQALPVTTPADNAQPYRDEIAAIAATIADLHASGASKNAMSKHAFGLPYGGRHATKIDAAIARLQASSDSSSQASSAASSASSHTSAKGDGRMEEEEFGRILKFKRAS